MRERVLISAQAGPTVAIIRVLIGRLFFNLFEELGVGGEGWRVGADGKGQIKFSRTRNADLIAGQPLGMSADLEILVRSLRIDEWSERHRAGQHQNTGVTERPDVARIKELLVGRPVEGPNLTLAGPFQITLVGKPASPGSLA